MEVAKTHQMHPYTQIYSIKSVVGSDAETITAKINNKKL